MSVEEPIDAPSSRRGKSLAGFYIAVGVVAALVGLGVWLWTPMRVKYWEVRVRMSSTVPPSGTYHSPCYQAARNLAELGPVSEPALERLLTEDGKERRVKERQAEVVRALGDLQANSWAVPLIVRALRRWREDRSFVVITAVLVMEHVVGKSFINADDEPKIGCDRVLDWWEREGRAKYEEPKK